MIRLCLLALLWSGAAMAQADPAALLRQPGAVGLLRHATAPGGGDPAGFVLGQCETQRNLSDAGRDQARRIGYRLQDAGVEARIYSSQWCRTLETGELLGIGPVTPLPALNSFFADRSEERAQTRAVLDTVRAWRGSTIILVTHQVNITALTGVYPQSGEMIMARLGPNGLVVTGRFTTP